MRFKMPDLAQFEKVTAKNQSKNKEKEELLKNLEKIRENTGKTVEDYIRDKYSLEYIDKPIVTDKQIENRAKEKIDLEKADNEKKLKDAYERKIEDNKKLAENEKVAVEVDKRNIENTYEDAKEGANNDAIKRGIARSTIISNLLKGYDQAKLKRQEEREDRGQAKLYELDDNIKKLNNQLENALKDLDMKSAYELNEEIEDLKRERDKENEKIASYNDRVDEKLEKYRKEFLKTDEGKEYEQGLEDKNLKDKSDMLKLIINYYDGIPYEEVIKDYNSTNYDRYLNANGKKFIKTYVEKRGYAEKNKN